MPICNSCGGVIKVIACDPQGHGNGAAAGIVDNVLDFSHAQTIKSELDSWNAAYSVTINKLACKQDVRDVLEEINHFSELVQHNDEKHLVGSMLTLLVDMNALQAVESDSTEVVKLVASIGGGSRALKGNETMALPPDSAGYRSCHAKLIPALHKLVGLCEELVKAWSPRLTATSRHRFESELLETKFPDVFSEHKFWENHTEDALLKLEGPKYDIDVRKSELLSVLISVGCGDEERVTIEQRHAVNEARLSYIAMINALANCDSGEDGQQIVDAVDKLQRHITEVEDSVSESATEEQVKAKDQQLEVAADSMKQMLKEYPKAFRLDKDIIHHLHKFVKNIKTMGAAMVALGGGEPGDYEFVTTPIEEVEVQIVRLADKVEGVVAIFNRLWTTFPDHVALCMNENLETVHFRLESTILEFAANPFCAPLITRIMLYMSQIEKIKSSLFDGDAAADVPFSESVKASKVEIIKRFTEAADKCVHMESSLRSYIACCQYIELVCVTFRQKNKDGSLLNSPEDQARIVKNFVTVMDSKANKGKVTLPKMIKLSLEQFGGFGPKVA